MHAGANARARAPTKAENYCSWKAEVVAYLNIAEFQKQFTHLSENYET